MTWEIVLIIVAAVIGAWAFWHVSGIRWLMKRRVPKSGIVHCEDCRRRISLWDESSYSCVWCDQVGHVCRECSRGHRCIESVLHGDPP